MSIYYGCQYYRHGCELGGPCDGCMQDADEEYNHKIAEVSSINYSDRVKRNQIMTSNYIKYDELMENNPMDTIVQVSHQAVQTQNCEAAMAVCQAIIQLFECKEKNPVMYSCNCNDTLLTVFIKKEENYNVLRISGAGLTKENYRVHIDNNGNLVVATHDTEEKSNNQRGVVSLGNLSYKQIFALPWGLKKEDIKAFFQDNALCIPIPIISTLDNNDSLFNVEIK